MDTAPPALSKGEGSSCELSICAPAVTCNYQHSIPLRQARLCAMSSNMQS
jgi:hypothetical protein